MLAPKTLSSENQLELCAQNHRVEVRRWLLHPRCWLRKSLRSLLQAGKLSLSKPALPLPAQICCFPRARPTNWCVFLYSQGRRNRWAVLGGKKDNNPRATHREHAAYVEDRSTQK
jgi:hypothetical protein